MATNDPSSPDAETPEARIQERLKVLPKVLTNAIDRLYANHQQPPYVQLTETTAQTLRRALIDAHDALSRLQSRSDPSAQGWRDIATAPKDSLQIVLSGQTIIFGAVNWTPDGFWEDEHGALRPQPHLWLPIPDLPANTQPRSTDPPDLSGQGR